MLDYVKRFGFDTTDFPRNTQLAHRRRHHGRHADANGARVCDVRERRLSRRAQHRERGAQPRRRDDLQAHYPVVCADCPQPETAASSSRSADARDVAANPDAPDSGAARTRRRQRLHHELDAAGRDPARHRDPREEPQPQRSGRQNRHDERSRYLVQRLSEESRGHRCGSDSATIGRSATTNTARTRRCRSGWTS